jgi:transposase
MELTPEALRQFFEKVVPVLDERQRRLVAGALAEAFGRGGTAWVAEGSGMSRNTVIDGRREIEKGPAEPGRVRAPGAGRHLVEDDQPGLVEALEALVSPATRGDPMSALVWTAKSTETLARELRAQGFTVSADTVGRLLKAAGYSLQAPAKTKEGTQHPDRDSQFKWLNGMVVSALAAGDPVISVDTKKKELIGEKANGGREYQPKGTPVRVDVHDFPDPIMGKAVPYGIYDIGANEGWVSVGDDGDTAVFAVGAIRRWWQTMGRDRYPTAARLLVTADAGGSNSYRTRLWKVELAKLAAETGLTITVCHYPPGTSKWNRIEHRMFSFITKNWRGRPLTSYRTVVELITATTTQDGLRIAAEWDHGSYPRGIKVTKAELAAVPIVTHDWHGEWNYDILPHPRT